MRLVVARENQSRETRVAIVPEVVGRLTALGCTVLVESGAGEPAGFGDDEYRHAGAEVHRSALGEADLVAGVQSLDADRIRSLRPGAAQVSFLPTGRCPELVEALRDAGATAFAMEQVPRISRAQPMDALTSQAMVVGYRGAVVAAGLLRRFFPLTMTAASTVPAAKVVVLGAGVAGLQAIATSRRLGADVSAYDVRASSAEEIASMGARFIDLGLAPLEGSRGYAREMTPKRAERQRALLAPHVAGADALITTASVPGRQAPLLVTTAMVSAMRPGSVVVDLAADVGGNVEGARPGELIGVGGVQLWGGENVAGQMPGVASELYARNVLAFISLLVRDGDLAPDFEDEIVSATLVVRDGVVVADQM